MLTSKPTRSTARRPLRAAAPIAEMLHLGHVLQGLIQVATAFSKRIFDVIRNVFVALPVQHLGVRCLQGISRE